MNKLNHSEMMKKAHAWARNNLKKVGDYKIALMLGMKEMWNQVRELGRFIAKTESYYTIKEWFMNKNADKMTTTHCHCASSFHKEDIIKETEKAFQVNLALITNAGSESAYTKLVWLPKSVCEFVEYETANI